MGEPKNAVGGNVTGTAQDASHPPCAINCAYLPLVIAAYPICYNCTLYYDSTEFYNVQIEFS
jgi:hypothetical protein